MSEHVQIHKPAVHRAIDAFNMAVAALRENETVIAGHLSRAAEDKAALAQRDARIAALEAVAAEDRIAIEALTAALNSVFPPDVGGSTGGVVG